MAFPPFREREYNALPNNLTFLFTSEVDAATSSFDLPGRYIMIYFNQQSSVLWADLHTLHHCHHEMIEMIFTDVARVTELAQVSNVPIIPREVLALSAWREKLYCRV